MSFAGLKKQLNKANQYLSEQMGTASATTLDEDYMELERKTDVMSGLIDDLVNRTREYLLPNPATRMKLATSAYVGKIRGTSNPNPNSITGGSTHSHATSAGRPYNLPEGDLGDAMCNAAAALGDRTVLSKTLADVGDAMRQLADVKYSLDENVKQNFIDPLTQLQNKDVKEHHRKKLHGRRLDYDCKRRNTKTPVGELTLAREKLQESKQLAEMSMSNLLDNDVEHVVQLSTLVGAQLDYHKQATDLLQRLQQHLNSRVTEARTQPRAEHRPKPLSLSDIGTGAGGMRPDAMNSMHSSNSSGDFGTYGVNENGGRDPQKSSGHSWNEPPKHSATNMNNNNNTGSSNYTSQSLYPSSADAGAQPAQRGWTEVQDPWEVGGAMQAPPTYQQVSDGQAYALAQFDFEPENPGELRLRDGEKVYLTKKIDDNWYEGRTENGESGYFPISYVKVVVSLH